VRRRHHYKAVKVAGTRSSDLVAVFGVGGLGHLAIQYAKLAGGRVVAVDLHDDKLEVCELHRAGLTRVISETRPLDHVNEAIADVEAGRVTARIVLQP
jgi:alcohol dehydrogenase, propanol-preferring